MIRRDFIIIERKQPKKSSEKWRPKRKEVTLLFLGAIISFLSAYLTLIVTNKDEKQKEFNAQKEAYADTCIKELNRNFFLLNYVIEHRDKKVDSKSRNYLKHLAEFNINWQINYKYDSLQVNRYFGRKYFDSLENIDTLISYKIRSLIADTTSDEKVAKEAQLHNRTQLFDFYKRIANFQTMLIAKLDKN